MANFEKKIVIVTGASSGMGRDAALYLAGKGVKGVTLFARRQEKLEEVAKEIGSKHPSVGVLVVAGDATKAADNERAVAETVKKFGGVTSVFINAGVFRGGKPIPETSDEDIDAVIDTNIKGVVYMMRYVLPAIKETVGAEGPAGSVVVNSSCMGASVISPKSAGSSIYSASKAFVNSLVETAAIENAPRIRVNAVLPGLVQTSIFPADDATYQAFGAKLQPLWGRPGQPAEISSLVAFLLSDEASMISGSLYKADGLWGLSDGSM